jgi:hypothetical protein
MTSDTRRTYLLVKERDYDIHRPVVNCSEMAYVGLLNRLSDVSGETGEAKPDMDGLPANEMNATEQNWTVGGV